MIVPRPTRRRFLRLMAGAAGMSLLPAGSDGPVAQTYDWEGRALGASARITVHGSDRRRLQADLRQVLDEVARLERSFSLFDPESEISRLNRDGQVRGASLDFRALINEALQLASATAGTFDPTIQPLWRLYADAFAASGPPGRLAIDEALSLVDFHAVEVFGATVRFARPGMALTLNGIAQGYITDRAADLLRRLGYDRVLVQLGETAARAPREGNPWRIGLPHPSQPGVLVGQFDVSDGAVATSSGAATRFDKDGGYHHLLDPKGGASPTHWQSVSVQAERATLADGLSTALAIAPEQRLHDIVQTFPKARVFTFSATGIARYFG